MITVVLLFGSGNELVLMVDTSLLLNFFLFTARINKVYIIIIPITGNTPKQMNLNVPKYPKMYFSSMNINAADRIKLGTVDITQMKTNKERLDVSCPFAK